MQDIYELMEGERVSWNIESVTQTQKVTVTEVIVKYCEAKRDDGSPRGRLLGIGFKPLQVAIVKSWSKA